MLRAAALRIVPAAVVAAVLAALTAWTIGSLGYFRPKQPGLHLWAYTAEWVLFAAAVLPLRLVPRRAAPALVLAGAAVIGGCALAAPPTTSTDAARYSWDGIVQDAGVSPYADVPADAALARLRPDWLFPAGRPTADGSARCPRLTLRTHEVGGAKEICTAINRPLVHTIYPPVAEIAFALVRLPVPASVAYLPVQLLGLAAVLGTTALLVRALRRRELPVHRAALFAWCPLTAQAGVNDAHVDGLAVLLAFGATLLVASGRPLRGGVLLGLAIATKFTPLLVVPPLIRRRPVAVLAAAAGAVAVVYVPYLLASGGGVLGYLPGYLNEEGYDDGTRSAVLGAVLPGAASTAVAALVVAATAVVVLLKADPRGPWTGQLVVVAVALLVLSPRYAWYALLLLPPVAMTGRWEWLAVPAALLAIQLESGWLPVPLVVLGAALVVVAGSAIRAIRRPSRLSVS